MFYHQDVNCSVYFVGKTWMSSQNCTNINLCVLYEHKRSSVHYNKYLMCKDVQNPLGHVAIKSDQILRAHYHNHTDRLRLHGILNFS